MLSKNKIKFIQSLHRKKNRDESGMFIAEGEKLVQQLMNSGQNVHTIICTPSKADQFVTAKVEMIISSYEQIKKASSLKSPQEVIAICSNNKPLLADINFANEIILALDDIQDPGNLGTIIRLASWFGIKNIVCSEHSVDCYNPKVIQSTMGAIAQVNIHYTNLIEFLKDAQNKSCPIFGTFLDGENIYSANLARTAIIVMGNEGNGISPTVKAYIDKKLYIPTFAEHNNQVESLNVSMATAIVCSEFMRRST